MFMGDRRVGMPNTGSDHLYRYAGLDGCRDVARSEIVKPDGREPGCLHMLPEPIGDEVRAGPEGPAYSRAAAERVCL
jgi:hypothetical protein